MTVSAVLYARSRPVCSARPLARAEAAESKFRVCADPENLPFSNRQLEGFENKIADLIAKEFGAHSELHLVGTAARFIRNTMNATLKEARCDVVIGVPAGYDLVRTDEALLPVDLCLRVSERQGTSDQIARRSDSQETQDRRPSAWRRLHESAAGSRLSKRGIVDNVVGFDTFYSAQNPPSAIIDAVASGQGRRRDRLGTGRRIFCRAPACAVGDGPDPVRKNGSAVRLRYLDGRQTGR